MADEEFAEFAVGIDLGTTNCAIAFASLQDDDAAPSALQIPQVVAPSEVAPRALLPSFLYFPASGQFPDGALALPWLRTATDVAGHFAREQGASSPARLVSSAKSWLSYDGVDRRAAILPWGGGDDIPKLSPLEASARYLGHLRAAWDAVHPDAPLVEQDVVLTVPASFDAVARELTVEAAMLAGFSEPPRVLEEPQAALYDWLAQRGPRWRDELAIGDLIVVVDIGGGTTDFSLITVSEDDGVLGLERVAVGDHILLGGDNVDLALAYTVKARLEGEGKKLDDWQMRSLTHSCRSAKEVLLGEDPPTSVPLVIPSRGSRLIGGSIRAELGIAEVEAVVLEGFFGEVARDAEPRAPRRAGLTTLGLPYATDASVTRHLAAFLARAQPDAQRPPTAILFNGGVTRSPKVRDRIVGLLGRWAEQTSGVLPKVLEGADAELAVGRGAAYYAHVRRRGGVRIRGGTAQSYYVGIERAELAVPGLPPRIDAVCIAPKGMEEGTEVVLDQEFGLWLGETVAFRFFGSAARPEDPLGEVVDPAELTELAPIETALDGEEGRVVQVRLHARVSEVGVLELSAVSESTQTSWRLSFDIRGRS